MDTEGKYLSSHQRGVADKQRERLTAEQRMLPRNCGNSQCANRHIGGGWTLTLPIVEVRRQGRRAKAGGRWPGHPLLSYIADVRRADCSLGR